MTPAVDVVALRFSYTCAGSAALHDIDLTIWPGQVVALLGPSGSGKTTLLTLLDDRLRGWQGDVSVLGVSLNRAKPQSNRQRADAGFIFQEFALVERSTVFRNVCNGRLGRMSFFQALFSTLAGHDADAVCSALSACGIADLAERRADSLSGGQRQRAAIARCLAQEPRLILADEPVSNLDPARAAEILSLICGAGRARGTTIIFSTHQPELAVQFADRIIGLKQGYAVADFPASAISESLVEQLCSGRTREQDRGSRVLC